MTIAKPIPWQDLLSRRFTNVADEYGPNSQAIASALVALGDTRWLEHVGEPWLEPPAESLNQSRVTVIKSWDEALAIFNGFPRYNINGVLQAACSPSDKVLERLPEREAWWQKAREEAKRYAALSGWIPESLPQEVQDLLFEHLWEFTSMLLVEIVVSPEAECTYFREQLTWFHAGHFPCGWDGDWPNGSMRIY